MSESTPRHILSLKEYKEVCDFISAYPGLAIDCEMEMLKEFGHIEKLALKSILETYFMNKRRNEPRSDDTGHKYLSLYEDLCEKSPIGCSTILLDMARKQRTGPVTICRWVLKTKYSVQKKTDLTKMLRYPHQINDPQLAANIEQCLKSDSQDGPLVDIMRRSAGEEYEFKLKEKASAAGMHFFDENDLRRMGYDKTPDIKMTVPFMYKGHVVNWVESKATFGDMRTHKANINQQLQSYCNRFGSGIIIYWYGYIKETATMPDNNIGIVVLADFPAKEDTVQMALTDDDDDSDPYDNDKKPDRSKANEEELAQELSKAELGK